MANTNMQKTSTVLPISIIVPFFNLETYVDRCIDCLVSQAYSNYEIICVDDGSTDKTLKKLQDREKTEKRIKVYTKPNGGLSDARNYGVEKANFDYISFVDGDDVVSPFYLASLAEALKVSQSRIAIGTFQKINERAIRKGRIEWNKPKEYKRLPISEGLERFLYDNPIISACAHLAPKSIYTKYPFKKGALYEDTLAFEEHVARCDDLVFIDTPIYGYVSRKESIVHSAVDSQRAQEHLTAIMKLDTFLALKYPELSDARIFHKSLELSRLFRRLSKKQSVDLAAAYVADQVRSMIVEEYPFLCMNKRINVANQVRFRIIVYFPQFYCLLFDLYDWAFG